MAHEQKGVSGSPSKKCSVPSARPQIHSEADILSQFVPSSNHATALGDGIPDVLADGAAFAKSSRPEPTYNRAGRHIRYYWWNPPLLETSKRQWDRAARHLRP